MFNKNINFSIESAKNPETYDLLFLTAVYSPKNDNKNLTLRLALFVQQNHRSAWYRRLITQWYIASFFKHLDTSEVDFCKFSTKKCKFYSAPSWWYCHKPMQFCLNELWYCRIVTSYRITLLYEVLIWVLHYFYWSSHNTYNGSHQF